MNAQQLTLPDVMDWCTIAGAARILGVDRATVTRMLTAKKLTAHHPRRGPGERALILIPFAEVDRLRKAREIALSRG